MIIFIRAHGLPSPDMERKIETIGFDWDGTLVDSMGTKAKSFAEATIKYLQKPQNVNFLLEKAGF